MNKPKLTISEQIKDLKNKGVTFDLISEGDACHYLTYDNYYFKLKSYAKNYDRYLSTAKKGQYINLDFAYLKDLADIDSALRKTVLNISLDIEHALKVQVMRDSSINDKCDG